MSKETVSRQIGKLSRLGFISIHIIYVDETKQIQERRLYLSMPDVHKAINDAPSQPNDTADAPPIRTNVDTPIDKNVNHNTTSNLNTKIDNNINLSTTGENEENDGLIDNEYNPKITEEQINKVVYNIQIDSLQSCHPTKAQNLGEILKIIIQVLKSNKKQYVISGETISGAEIKNSFLQLHAGYIEYLLESLSDTTTRIKNIRNYLIKSLMNAISTINNHYTQRVNHDLENIISFTKA